MCNRSHVARGTCVRWRSLPAAAAALPCALMLTGGGRGVGVGGATAAAAALRGCGSPGPAAPSFLRLISALSEGSPGGGRLGEEWKPGPAPPRMCATWKRHVCVKSLRVGKKKRKGELGRWRNGWCLWSAEEPRTGLEVKVPIRWLGSCRSGPFSSSGIVLHWRVKVFYQIDLRNKCAQPIHGC